MDPELISVFTDAGLKRIAFIIGISDFLRISSFVIRHFTEASVPSPLHQSNNTPIEPAPDGLRFYHAQMGCHIFNHRIDRRRAGLFWNCRGCGGDCEIPVLPVHRDFYPAAHPGDFSGKSFNQMNLDQRCAGQELHFQRSFSGRKSSVPFRIFIKQTVLKGFPAGFSMILPDFWRLTHACAKTNLHALNLKTAA